MKRIGLFANPKNERVGDVLARIEAAADRLGLALFADPQTCSLGTSAQPMRIAEMEGRVDALLALGGDGTMLRAVRELKGHDLPVMGLNIGSLGFMTSVGESDLDRALECLAEDYVFESSRTMIQCSVGEGEAFMGLNDVVIQGVASSRVITLDMAINGETVASYVCDGLIFATPTGSTAHSLSAGGPIIMPGTSAFVVSVICPHSLSARPLVIPNDCHVTFVCPKASKSGLMLSVDGHTGPSLDIGDVVHVSRAAKDARFLHLPEYSYFPVLRQKLGWRGSHV